MTKDFASVKKLSSGDFVDYAYTHLLRKNVDEKTKSHFVSKLESGTLTREDVLLTLVTSKEYAIKHAPLEFVPPGHFYSAIPSLEDRERYFSRRHDKAQKDIPGVELNDNVQLDLMEKLKPFYEENPFSEKEENEFRFKFDNPAFSPGDALSLYSMIRHFQPKRVVEVGSGYSSCVTMDTNDCYFDGEIDLTFIEPYPELLFSLMKEGEKEKHEIITTSLQDVDLKPFEALQENDILFIDSTHVSKLESDVNTIFFELLPSLKRGVIVHFHDIFWPLEYPSDWLKEGRAWNEMYILRAFLQYNESFEVLLFPHYLLRKHREWLETNVPLAVKHFGCNIWIRKK